MQWQFRQAPDGAWCWECWNSEWRLLASAGGFASFEDAEANAAGHGYVAPRRTTDALLWNSLSKPKR
jgi:hypothetical protein